MGDENGDPGKETEDGDEVSEVREDLKSRGIELARTTKNQLRAHLL